MLIQKFEDCTQANEETGHHLKEEMEKHDKFLVEKIEVDETFRLKKELSEETKALNDKNKQDIDTLKAKIKTDEKATDDRQKDVEKLRRDLLFEKAKNQKFAKNNAALLAKHKFILKKYDQTSAVKNLDLRDLRELVESNNKVNNELTNFQGKLGE